MWHQTILRLARRQWRHFNFRRAFFTRATLFPRTRRFNKNELNYNKTEFKYGANTEDRTIETNGVQFDSTVGRQNVQMIRWKPAINYQNRTIDFVTTRRL